MFTVTRVNTTVMDYYIVNKNIVPKNLFNNFKWKSVKKMHTIIIITKVSLHVEQRQERRKAAISCYWFLPLMPM